METLSPKPRLRRRLDHFSAIEDDRPAWRVMYPRREVLFEVAPTTSSTQATLHVKTVML
jgi:hypothetical protein